MKGAYHLISTSTYYLKDGQKQRVYNGNMDAPENFIIFELASAYYLRLFPSEHLTGAGQSTTFIEFNKTDTDTLVCDIRASRNSIICTRVMYNNKLVWDGEGPRSFDIEK